jgi:hypothetical protein
MIFSLKNVSFSEFQSRSGKRHLISLIVGVLIRSETDALLKEDFLRAMFG